MENKQRTHRPVSISMKTINLIENAKQDIAEYKHLSLPKVVDLAVIEGIESMLKKQEAN